MIITKTPYRVSFFGGGTDFPLWYRKHGGSVISTAINQFCYVSV
ncbi:MAG: kinase, partial [Bacteroidota bacterium]